MELPESDRSFLNKGMAPSPEKFWANPEIFRLVIGQAVSIHRHRDDHSDFFAVIHRDLDHPILEVVCEPDTPMQEVINGNLANIYEEMRRLNLSFT